MYTKWGFDGSSGHSSYKQVFHGIEASDSAVFITSIVPIRIVLGEKVVWQNPTPSSTRYCRPLKIEFIKESSEVSIAEKNRVTEEIGNLKNLKRYVMENLLKLSTLYFLLWWMGKFVMR